MEIETARWLVSPAATAAIARAATFAEPSSLQAGTALRRDLTPDQAAAVLDLVALRRRAEKKLGPQAARLFLTRDGLEQATRWDVARWRAGHLAALGAERVVDAGCGLGVDALACRIAGLRVTAIERDPVLAVLAAANLASDQPGGAAGATATVVCAALETVDLPRDEEQTALFLDPARRNPYGRSWDVADLSPSWATVQSLLERTRGPVVVKLAPGFPRELLPEDASVTWVSHRGDLVETTLWPGLATGGTREAVVLAGEHEHRLTAGDDRPAPGPLDRYLYEPDPAVIRAQATGTLARRVGAHLVAPGLAYLTGGDHVATPFAEPFEIEEGFPFSERALRSWARSRNIGTLEIKTRGQGIDPAQLRRTLRLRGERPALVILTPTTAGAMVLVAHRLRGSTGDACGVR
ncbi:MAG: class I SAM-dependent methyltransferase [Propionibacteriaceae bacterium]|jgi:hypothetical protein|nr:class I SAM-dependent methyltransferase [Propionibacteriaceae bacterium]